MKRSKHTRKGPPAAQSHYRSDRVGGDHHSLDLLERDLENVRRVNSTELGELLKARKRDEAIERLTPFARWCAWKDGATLVESEAISVAFLELVTVIDALLALETVPEVPLSYIRKAIQSALTESSFREASPLSMPYASKAVRDKASPHRALAYGHALRMPIRFADDAYENEDGSVNTLDSLIAAPSAKASPGYAGSVVRRHSALQWLPYGTRLDTSFPPPDAEVLRDSDRRVVQLLLESAVPPLTDEELAVIQMRFGLVDGVENNLEEIAEELSMSVSWVKVRSASAMKKLKAASAPELKNTLASGLWKVRNGQRVKEGQRDAA